MSRTRREFLAGAVAAGAGLGLAGMGVRTALARPDEPAKKLKLLILGGTAYLGPEIVEEALSRGHEMTLFNRGKTRPELFPDLEKLKGDRDSGDLEALKGRKWDAVIDTSGYVPREVRQSTEVLKDSVGQYVFISSVSAYATWGPAGMDETSPEATMEDPTNEDVGQYYGALKALCEHAAEDAMPGRVTNIRPGLIVGPGDWTQRFNYWPCRVAEGGEVLAPGDPGWFVQVIDVRDLAAFIVHCIERKHMGWYNADSPEGGMTTARMLEGCKRATGSDASFTWVDAEFLEKEQVSAWQDLPAWIPPLEEYSGFGQVSTAKARKAGLKCRPIEETAKDAWEWVKQLPPERQPKWGEPDPRGRMTPGLTRQREKEVLAAWKARQAE